MFSLAPLGDTNNVKIVPCDQHRNEFHCTSFFNMFAVDNLPMIALSTGSHDSFTFDISKAQYNVISFRVSIQFIYQHSPSMCHI